MAYQHSYQPLFLVLWKFHDPAICQHQELKQLCRALKPSFSFFPPSRLFHLEPFSNHFFIWDKKLQRPRFYLLVLQVHLEPYLDLRQEDHHSKVMDVWNPPQIIACSNFVGPYQFFTKYSSYNHLYVLFARRHQPFYRHQVLNQHPR